MTALDLRLIRKTARATSQGGGAPHSLDRMTDVLEIKTVWHPIGV